MIPTGWLQAPYAVLFVTLTLVALRRIVAPQGWVPRVTTAFEVLMGAAMLIMVFNWGVSRAVPLQVIVFSLGAIWYLARALGLDERFPSGASEAHTHGPLHLGYHALLMLTMVWMVLAMIPHGRPVTGHFGMIGVGQLVYFVLGIVLSGAMTVGTIVLAARLARGVHHRLAALYDVGMSLGMLAMTAPMINW